MTGQQKAWGTRMSLNVIDDGRNYGSVTYNTVDIRDVSLVSFFECRFVECTIHMDTLPDVAFYNCRFENCTFLINDGVPNPEDYFIKWTGSVFVNCKLPADIQALPDIHRRVSEEISDDVSNLNAHYWHECETTHCRAGWVNVLNHSQTLEQKYGPSTLAALIYAKSHHGFPVPSFFAETMDALHDIRACAEKYPNPEPMV